MSLNLCLICNKEIDEQELHSLLVDGGEVHSSCEQYERLSRETAAYNIRNGISE